VRQHADVTAQQVKAALLHDDFKWQLLSFSVRKAALWQLCNSTRPNIGSI
jgi:hypothetical protein